MAAPVTKLQPIKLPAGPSPVTPEQQYWTQFKSQQLVTSASSFPITHISFPSIASNTFNASSNDYFAVTAGPRVEIFSCRTKKLVKQISRFKDIAHSGEIRRDGRLIVAGDDTGAIQVFDIGSRAILKTWEVHKQPVWTTSFSPKDLTSLMSTSDDRTIRLWDLPSQDPITTFSGHNDYVRAGAFMPGSTSGLLVSGSYDETVRIWDPRAPNRSAMTFKHGAPVESVLPMPSGTTVLASADNRISVLDLVAAKPLTLLKNHQKTVTSLCLASENTRLVSGGLDGHMKVFETTGWNVVAGSKYPSPILFLSIISTGNPREDKHIAVGMQSGTLSIRTRFSGPQQIRQKEREKEMKALIEGNIEAYDAKNAKKRPRGIEKRLRGRDFLGEGADVIIEGNDRRRKKTEAPWEAKLRKNHFHSALDLVLEQGRYPPLIVITCLIALRHRSAMRTALQGRDEVTLQPMLRWIIKHIVSPQYQAICVEVAMHLIELYSGNLGLSPEIDNLIRLLHGTVKKEVERAQQAFQAKGMIEMLVAGAG